MSMALIPVDDINHSDRWLPELEKQRRLEAKQQKQIDRVPPLMNCRVLSCDLAKRTDYAVLSLLDSTNNRVTVANLERMRGASYTVICDRARDIMRLPQMQGAFLVIDRTGVGEATMDMLLERGLEPYGIAITAGDSVNRVSKTLINVPKKEIVFALVNLVNTGRIKITSLSPETQHAASELASFVLKPGKNDDTYIRMEANGNAHDDIVMSIGLGAFFIRYKTQRQSREASQYNY
jgi:hypothetical protein